MMILDDTTTALLAAFSVLPPFRIAVALSPASANSYAGPLAVKIAHVAESATSTSMTFTYHPRSLILPSC